MAERAISVRLDATAARALEFLMRDGASRSEAIRNSIVDAARRDKLDAAAAEAEALARDADDLREIAELQAVMEDLRAER